MNKVIKVNFRSILLHIFMFMALLYPFNSSLASTIFGTSINVLVTTSIGMMGVFLFSKKSRINKKTILVLVGVILFLLLTLINNGYLRFGFGLRVAIYSLFIVFLFIIYLCPDTMKVFCNVLCIFAIEHISVTLIGVFFKDFYKTNILSLICENNTYCPAAGNYFHGYVPGLTSNFSMNAIYLSIFSTFFFSIFMSTKKKTSFIMLILSLICLFVAGKRAHLIFSIMSCAMLYFVFKKDSKLINKIITFSLVAVLGVIFVIVLSNYVPEIMNVINRFVLLLDEGDLANGRGELYDLAIMLWKQHMLLGNGWGSFAYNYPIYIHNPDGAITNDAHNVYLQLLCEVGIVGAIIIIAIMIFALVSAYKNIVQNDYATKEENVISKFSFCYQLFFLMYCVTGNPLYDHFSYSVYFILVGFTLYMRFNSKEIKNEKSRDNNIL